MTNPVPAPVDACVAVVRWPCDAAARVRARATGTPCLLMIEPGTAPPSDCALDEDWTTTTAPPADVAARLATLATRPPRRHRLPSDLAAELDDAAIAVYDLLAERAPRPPRSSRSMTRSAPPATSRRPCAACAARWARSAPRSSRWAAGCCSSGLSARGR